MEKNRIKGKLKNIYWLPSTVLVILGVLDLIRGIMHTFLLTWSANNIAGFNPATATRDQYFLLGVFGISNFLTGFLYLLISRKARQLAPDILILIPLVYLLGILGILSGGIHPQAAFEGKYFMMVYFAICLITFLIYQYQKWMKNRSIEHPQAR